MPLSQYQQTAAAVLRTLLLELPSSPSSPRVMPFTVQSHPFISHTPTPSQMPLLLLLFFFCSTTSFTHHIHSCFDFGRPFFTELLSSVALSVSDKDHQLILIYPQYQSINKQPISKCSSPPSSQLLLSSPVPSWPMVPLTPQSPQL